MTSSHYKKKPLILVQNKNVSKRYLVDVVGKNWAIAIVWIVALSISWKIFRCGGRTELTALDWLVEHSVFGSPIQYVPEESYMKELEGTWIDEQGNLRW